MVREMETSKPCAAVSVRLKASPQPATKPPKPDASDAAKILFVVEAAERIFLEKGFHTATMNDVAKAAGMSKKTIYKLIDSKAGLFEALMEHHAEKLVMPAIKEGWTLNEILVQFLLCLGRHLVSPTQISIIRLIMAEYTHSNDFGRIFYQKRVTKAKMFLENWLSQICPPVYVRVADVREMSAMLFGMALGEFFVNVLIGFKPMPSKFALNRRIRGAVNIFLAGCEKK